MDGSYKNCLIIFGDKNEGRSAKLLTWGCKNEWNQKSKSWLGTTVAIDFKADIVCRQKIGINASYLSILKPFDPYQYTSLSSEIDSS